MRIAICEDDVLLCSQLAEWLRTKPGPDASCRKIKTYHTGDHFWFDYQESSKPFDLILLDIEMPGALNGLEVAKRIRTMDDQVPIVILTAFTKYALAGYEVQPFQYLVKPVEEQKMLQIVEQVENKLYLYWRNCLNVPVQGGFLRIPFGDITYLESRAHNVYIHTRKQTYKLYRKLEDILELCDNRFLYSHKSYAVNADMIRQIESRYSSITLQDGTQIPISQPRKGAFIQSLALYDQMYETIQA